MASESVDVLNIILEASVVVKLVMLSLLLASLVSWSLIVQRWWDFRQAFQSMKSFEAKFWSGIDLTQLYQQARTDSPYQSGQENIFKAGFKEFMRLRQMKNLDHDMVMEGTQRAMRVVFQREQDYLERHLPFLATVGSITPYIGLFGTVWGIMNSFLALAQQNQATLQVVAPDIAEALIATAMGLFAAIPAVMAYNRFSSRSESLLRAYVTFADEFSSILSRKAHSE
jgi:biopolymer transport protein TolQ